MKNISKKPGIRFKNYINDWEQRKLGSITDSFSGGTPSAGNSEYYGGTIPFIRSGEISSDKTELFVTEVGLNNSSAKMVKKGDILYALYGATSGEVSISKINGAINQAILAIRSIENDDHYLIAQWLRTQKERIISTYLQGGQGNLSGSIVKGLMITLPENKDEQKMISLFFSNLDNLITLHQRKLNHLKLAKTTFLNMMFPKKDANVPEFRFAKNNDVWEQRKLGEILTERNVQHPQNKEYPLVSFTVENGVTPKTDRYEREQLVRGDKSQKKYKATELDDIVYNPANLKFGAIARNKYGKAVFSPIYVTFEVNKQLALPMYVERFVTRQDFIQYSLQYQQGTVYERQSVSPEDLLSLGIPIPSTEEQKEIGKLFDSFDTLITLHQRKLEGLEDIKKYYLKHMFV